MYKTFPIYFALVLSIYSTMIFTYIINIPIYCFIAYKFSPPLSEHYKKFRSFFLWGDILLIEKETPIIEIKINYLYSKSASKKKKKSHEKREKARKWILISVAISTS